MKIRPGEAELFHADRWLDGLDEVNSRFHNFANAPSPSPQSQSTVLSNVPPLPKKSTAFWKVPRLRPFVLLIKAT